MAAVQVQQLQEPASEVIFHDELGNRGQNLLHCLEVESLQGDVWSLSVFLQYRLEALCLSGRFVYPLRPKSFCFLHEALGVAACTRKNVLLVGVRQVDDPLLVLSRPHDVIEGVLHFRRRVDVQQLDFRHADARLIRVEKLLQQDLRLCLHCLLLGRQHVVDAPAAYHLPQSRLRRVFDGLSRGIDRAEEEFVDELDIELNQELHVDDILVAGNH